MPRAFEMRTYKTKAGLRDEFLEIFRSRSISAHEQIGMKIIGPFLSTEDPDTLFFMRIFPDLASRAAMKSQFYDGALWKTELENKLLPMIDSYQAVVIEDTDAVLASLRGTAG